MKYMKYFESLDDDIKRLGDLSFANSRIGKDSNGTKYIQVEKIDGGNNFLTIVPRDDGRYTINVTSGTINKPNTNIGATWYDLHNKRHTLPEVYDVMISYGIASREDKEFNVSIDKYNL